MPTPGLVLLQSPVKIKMKLKKTIAKMEEIAGEIPPIFEKKFL